MIKAGSHEIGRLADHGQTNQYNLAKSKWDISPTMHDLPSQCKLEGTPDHGQTGEDNCGECLSG